VRSDGLPTYNFVVVVDDHEMGVTHVARGDDHLNNTPKQQALYQLLGWEHPRFAHMPLILDDEGKKLSKRHPTIKTLVHEHRADGMLAEALINYLTRLGWAHGEMEEFSTDESIAVFSLEAVNKTGARWDIDKLMWLNQQWMKRLSDEVLAARVQPFFEQLGLQTDDRLPAVVATLKERSRTLVEMAEKGAFYFRSDEDIEYDPGAVKKFMKASRGEVLRSLIAALETVEVWSAEALEERTNAFLEAGEMKLSKVAQPIRVSLTGQKIGPGLYETLAAIGRERALARLTRGAEMCEARAQNAQ